MNIKNVSIGLTLVCVALHSAALTIGPAQGAAWIGRPLDLRIPVIVDTPSEATALCSHADVYYAETQQDPSRIQIQQEPTEQADTVRLRLRSGILVDEPVVTITLRVGCEDKSTRRFVLLADLPLVSDSPPERIAADLPVPLVTPPPTEASAASAPALVASAAANNVERRASILPDSGSAATATASTSRPAVRQPAERAPATRMAATRVKPPAPAAAAKPARAQGGSRLQLDPLEILLDRVKTLEIATATPPVEAVSKESELLLRMESDLKSLREQTAKNDATLAALQKRLEQAESDRVSAELFYGLLAVVVVCAAAVVALWQRRRSPVAVREEPMEDEPEPYEAQFLRKTLDAEKFEAPTVRTPMPTPEPEPSAEPVDVNLLDLDEPPWPDTSITVPRRL